MNIKTTNIIGVLAIPALIGFIMIVLFSPFENVEADPSINGNIIYLDPGERLYVKCEQCEGIVFNERYSYVQGMHLVGTILDGTPIVTIPPTMTLTMEPSPTPTIEPATSTPLPVETGQPVPTETTTPTATPLPTQEMPTVTPTVEQVVNGCVDQSRVGDFENYIALKGDMVVAQDASIEHLGLDQYIEATANHPNTSAIQPYDSESYAEWCFYPEFVGTYEIEMAVYGATNQDDSFWVRVDHGAAYLVEWRERLPVRVIRATARRQTFPIRVEVSELGEPVYIRLHPREDGARLYSIHLAQLGPPATSTPLPPTPEPTAAGEYPPPQPTINPYP